jgi:hypothetical protein
MTLHVKDNSPQRMEIDLDGPEGNVFCLIVAARMLSSQVGLDPEEVKEDMQSADYYHAVAVFEHHFGSYVDMYGSKETIKRCKESAWVWASTTEIDPVQWSDESVESA